MKILVVTFYSSWGMGEYVRNALLALGHDVDVFYTNSGGSFVEKAVNRAQYVRGPGLLFQATWRRMLNERLLKKAAADNPELFFVIKGDELSVEALEAVKHKYNALLVNWLPDNPFYLGHNNFISTLACYDYIFSFDPGILEQLKTSSRANIAFLPLCAEPNVHKKIQLSNEENNRYGCDISFVGTASAERAELLRTISDYDLAVWGEGWHKEKVWLKQRYKGRASGQAMVTIFNSSKIVLNIHHPQTREGANLRTFEICGSGAFQLVDKRASLEKLFNIGSEIVCYENTKELRERIDYFLNHEQERIAIADNGYRKVLSEHTYQHRLRQMFKLIGR